MLAQPVDRESLDAGFDDEPLSQQRQNLDRLRDENFIGARSATWLRDVAKVLNRRFASDPVMVSRFIAEARAVNQIRNRNIIDIFSFGALEDGRQYYVMELLDGMTELTPYRIDGRKVIAEFEAAQPDMPGTAARVLDYSTIWIHADGSARMLEHEILYIQEREGIQEQAEQRPRGLLLKIRTIKRDGRVLEPEIVPNKETITMPHLEIGDYIETETITTLRGDGQGGQRFEGPRWFFREEKIPYFRSEFITISPKNRPLDIETGGTVPRPEVSESGALVMRRWRVDKSPALPEEMASAPIQEFLPNVRIGWGSNLQDTVARMVDAAADETPRDPRLSRVAAAIIRGEMPVSAAPNSPISAREKICHMVPTTFQGISIGSAVITSASPTAQPRLGRHRAMAIPSGTSIASAAAENARVRNSASAKRAPISVLGSSKSVNHVSPFQKKLFTPMESCSE